MNVKASKSAEGKTKGLERKELGRLLLQVLPGKPGGIRTEEFKRKLRREFGEATEPSGAGSRAEMDRAAQMLLAQLQEYNKTSSRRTNSSKSAGVRHDALSSPAVASKGPKSPKGRPPAKETSSVDRFRFEHPAIIAQRLKRLPAKSQETELDQLEGEVARQVRFLIWQWDTVQVPSDRA